MPAAPDRILIVEDEQLVALDLEGTLRDLGYEIAGHAATADEAVAIANREQPDLVLMDVNLGGGDDGITAAGRIRKERDVPIIFVTAYDDETTLIRAQISEPYEFILKPYQPREIRACIRMALYHHVMQRERARIKQELSDALAENRVLQGLLTICGQCRKIDDRENGWVSLERYVELHSLAKFSHGLCPTCAKAYLDDFHRQTRTPLPPT